MEADAVERKRATVTAETRRAISAGLMETGSQSLFILIAINQFHASATEKAILASAGSFGNLIGPLIVIASQALRLRSNFSAGILHLIGALILLLSCLESSLLGFMIGAISISALTVSSVPFISQIYQENYPLAERGRLVAKTSLVRILVGAVAAMLLGKYLNGNISNYIYVLLIFGVANLFASRALFRCPSNLSPSLSRRELFVGFLALKSEPIFRTSIIGWMLMGLGSFIALPLRTELLSNSRFGLEMNEFQIALLVVTVPNIGRLILTPVWGVLFDKFHFTAIRTAANCMAVLSVVTFFTSGSVLGLICGSLFQGAAIAGGELCWILWTTTITKGQRVASYTAVHTFFTGVRGVIGPLIGFHLLEQTSPYAVAGVSTVLMVISSFIFVSEGTAERKRRKVKPIGELNVP